MTNDKQRERLVELLGEELLNYSSWSTEMALQGTYEMPSAEEVLADKLLADGWMRPPCKVGDIVYEALPKCGYIRSLNVVGFHLGKFPDLRGHKRKEYLVCYSDYSLTHIDIDKFGKTVFLSKEEAEQALVTDKNVGCKKEEGVQG
ncbi:MAG: hypothetical protein IJZ81_04970 [Clostridia bacterium]|nr:hypothetical protein [Clostridia bacterium]